jgi:antitoxin (DNA-binding transcriptional repressor) of toxin-antitoxin stability system
MSTITLAEAQRRLPELVAGLVNGTEEWIILDGHGPVALLSSAPASGLCTSLHDLKPTSLSGVLRAYPNPQDDLLGEMSARGE